MSLVAKGPGLPYRLLRHRTRGTNVGRKRRSGFIRCNIGLYGQWIREHNWCKVEAFSKKEAAEKVCGVALTEAGKLAQLRALTLGDLKQLARRRIIRSSRPLPRRRPTEANESGQSKPFRSIVWPHHFYPRHDEPDALQATGWQGVDDSARSRASGTSRNHCIRSGSTQG